MKSKKRFVSSIFREIGKCVFFIFLVFFGYVSLFFIPIDGVTIKQSKMILLACMVGFCILGILLRFKRIHKIGYTVLDVLAGIGVYVVLAYRKYYSKQIFVILLCLILLSLFLLACNIIEGSMAFKGEKKNLSVHKLIWENLLVSLNFLERTMGVLALILLIPIVYGRFVNKGIMVPSEEKPSLLASYGDRGEFSGANFEKIVKIRMDSTWNELTLEEKLNTIQCICNYEANYWGLSEPVKVVLDSLSGNTIASYYDDLRIVKVDTELIESGTAYSVLESILHEMYHAWQHDLVRLYLDSKESQRKMKVFEKCPSYIKEMQDYQSGGEDYGDFVSYYLQEMEKDAREYATEGVIRYYQWMDNMLRLQ